MDQMKANATNPYGMCRGNGNTCINCAVGTHGFCAKRVPDEILFRELRAKKAKGE